MDEFTLNLNKEIGQRLISKFPLVTQQILKEWDIEVSSFRLIRIDEAKAATKDETDALISLTFQLPNNIQMEQFNTEWGVRFYTLLLYLHQQQIVTIHTLFISSKEEHDITYAWLPLSGLAEAIPTQGRIEDNG